MTFATVLPLLRDDPGHVALARDVRRLRPGRVLEVEGLPSSARYPVLAALATELNLPMLLVTGRQDGAEELAAALAEYLPESIAPLLWPAPEALPYEQLPLDRGNAARRVEVLARLAQGDPAVVVTPARGLTQLLRAPAELAARTWHLRPGHRLRPDQFVAGLLDEGFELVPVVRAPGEVGKRGGIIDVFPPSAEHALRVELFGDEIESLRVFDPESQRSIRQVDAFDVLPPLEIGLRGRDDAVAALRALDASGLRPEVLDEWERTLRLLEHGDVTHGLDLVAPFLLDETASLLDYLTTQGLVVLVEPASIQLSVQQLEAQAEELRDALEDAGELPVGLPRPYLRWPDVAARLATVSQLALGPVPTGWAASLALVPEAAPAYAPEIPLYAGRFDAFLPDVRQWLAEGRRVLLGTEQSARLTELLEEHDIFPRTHKRSAGPPGATDEVLPPSPGTVEVVHSRLHGGWQHPGLGLVLLSDRELFGYQRVAQQPPRRRVSTGTALLRGLAPGKYVVHVEHGIARYGGLVHLDVGGVSREYLLLEYAEGDRLYLPVDQIDRITVYEGGGLEPKLTRLGSPEWARVKQRVRNAVRAMAFELLQLYAAREAASGHPFSPDGPWDRELEESFPYVETPDQARAIEEVRLDMERPTPMDRLVCGDVGYGKTEVALRAAFKAVNDGYQVAVLVPTTILALQHYHTFRSRLAAFPVKVEMLSRLRSRQDQQQVLARLAAGEVDIVIGTHRMLQKDVQFHRLGLLVIDEEQRFGVSHKEQLKRARTDVDVLTMTATPIPRTLHMALTGIRDLSVINTAPQDRTPIRTFVTPAHDALVREAILREMSRGGQTYFVHNRVQSIQHVLAHLQQLVPEARFGVGHGQMEEVELEQVMLSFMQHEFDVLVCTTIIESGVDIPNVNTVIIDRAQNLGLTQLYQLRGRVGRSHHRAYAYLLYDANLPLTAEAVARLEAIQEATELGAGFQIALRDLEIRGAGNVLGAEQSGHIAAVGFDLYTRMLAMAVEEVRQGRPIEEPEAVSVDLPIEAGIPEDYVGDEDVRIDLYRRIAAVRSYGELRDLQEEMIDRFGALPESLRRLVEVARLRVRASGLGITSIVEREGEVYVRPVVGGRLDESALRRELGAGVHVTPNQVRLTTSRLTVDIWTAVQRMVVAIDDAAATVLAAAS
ncbi:MAG TPA: transcription-repair coupling factor [Thermomicrobiaceae bacterium]|nr:transcription-repair coupling factor [Thermomicrobiaceae bacterium]